jgi:pimeloyl-ACP methyl ester carboxylesterase
MKDQQIAVNACGRQFQIHYFDRPGAEDTLLFVHGLGCSADDFAAMTEQPALQGCRLVALDQPGCGRSPYDVNYPVNIDCLVEVLEAFVNALKLDRFLLVGASMGGLIGLLYAERNPEKIKGFVNVEGNLTPEDCIFSRHVVGHSFENFEENVFPKIKQGVAAQRGRGFASHLAVVQRANSRAYYDNSFQLVKYSHEGNLLKRFLALPMEKYFVYGDENRHLKYLPTLRKSSCRVFEVAQANHFLFYDDPEAFADILSECRGAVLCFTQGR